MKVNNVATDEDESSGRNRVMGRPVMSFLYYSAGMLIVVCFWAISPVFLWDFFRPWRQGQSIAWFDAGMEFGLFGFYLVITPVIARRWRRLLREVRR